MMKAFIINGPHEVRIADVRPPEVEAGEALVRVEYCGICGSDLHAYEGTQPFFEYPQIPGHEVVGEIADIGPKPEQPMQIEGRPVGENLSVGTRVVADPAVPCGACYPCTHGRYNCCENQRVIGVHMPGAMAEYFSIPLGSLHVVPERLPSRIAVLAEPLSIGVQANTRGRIDAEDDVLVIGCGTIGLCVMVVAKSRGARVVMTDLLPERRRKAVEMGADAAIDPAAPDFEDEVRGSFEWGGPSVAVEAVGTPATLNQALDSVLPAGRVVLLGLIAEDVTIPGDVMVRKELDFVGSRLHGGTVPQAIDLLVKRQSTIRELITDEVSLESARQALDDLAMNPGTAIKTIVRLGG